MTPRSFLFATIAVETGQLVPIFAVARELVARGHRVRMLLGAVPGAAPDRIVDRAAAAGCETILVSPMAPAFKPPPPRQALLGWTPKQIGMPLPILHWVYWRSPAWARRTTEELAAWPTDVVVADSFFPGVLIGAEAAGTPAVSLVHSVYTSGRPGLIPHGAGFRPPKSIADRAKQELWRHVHRRLLARNALPGINAARVAVGLDPVASDAEQEDRVPRVLVLSHPGFDFPKAALPANVRITGWPIPAALGETWAGPWAPDDDRPLVLLSPSTTTQAQEQLPFFRRALEALDGLHARGLLTVGPSADIAAFEAPANVVVEAFVPHAAVLPQAAAVVSHCGHGTVMTALSYGVPIVCVPGGRDQNDVAARVVVAGAGVELSMEDALPAAIRDAISAVTSMASYRERAGAIAAAMAHEDGAANAANEIESLVPG